MAFNDTKQFINAVVQHQDARGISKNEILADKVAVDARNKSERLKPRKQSRTGYGGGGELEESSGGGGISGPLVEVVEDIEGNSTPRTFYPSEVFLASDGVFSWKLRQTKAVHMKDASNTFFDMEFLQAPIEDL